MTDGKKGEMGKGLDWIVVASDIAFDDDIEHVSDAAFRTYIELLGLSAFRLSDGHISLRDARKICNTRHLASALSELSRTGHVELDDESIYLPKYVKWQKTRGEIESSRAKIRDRVTRYRGVTSRVSNGVGNAVRVEKSREEYRGKEEAPVDNSPATDPLVSYALQELPQSESTPADYLRTINRYRTKLADEHIERIIAQLGAWPGTKGKTKLHLTLASWLNKEPRDPMPPSLVPFVPPQEDPANPYVPMPEEVKAIAATMMGRGIG